jgi:TRAP-type uncharacterized transport system substrate-binding protein
VKPQGKSWVRKLVPTDVGRELRRYGSFAGLMLVLFGLLTVATFWYVLTPTRLKIALPPGPEASALNVFADVLQRGKKSVRLDPVPVPDLQHSADALEQGKVQLAIVQPDVLYPAHAGTVAILREEAIIIVARSTGKDGEKEGISQLKDRTLAVLARRESDLSVVKQILAHYDLDASTRLVAVEPAQAEERLKADSVDAAILLATPGSAEADRLVRQVGGLFGDNAAIVPLEGTEMLVRKLPDLTETKLPAGSFGRMPKEEAKTVGVSYRLVANNNLDRAIVAEIADLLFRNRALIARTEPVINFMEAPDDDTSMTARLPNHRGTIDYLNREQVTFMSHYGDWIWLALFAGGGVTSLFGWLAQTMARKRREAVDSVLDRLLKILAQARNAQSRTDLDRLALELDELVAKSVRLARTQATSNRTMGSLIVAFDGARAAMADRRRELAADGNETRAEPEEPDVPSRTKAGRADQRKVRA